jgi:hypothetical protein
VLQLAQENLAEVIEEDHGSKIGESYYVKRQEGGIHLFCGKCKQYNKPKEVTFGQVKGTLRKLGHKIENAHDFNTVKDSNVPEMDIMDNDYETALLVCSKCGHAVDFTSLTRLNYKGDNTSFSYACVFDHGDKVALKYATKTITMWHDKLQYKFTEYKIIFNTLTGQTYKLEPWVNGKRAKGYKGPKVMNITYGSTYAEYIYSVPLEKRKELFNMIYEKIQARFPFKVPTLEEYFAQKTKPRRIPLDNACYNIDSIVLFNRMPFMNPDVYSKLVGNSFRKYKFIKVKQEDGEIKERTRRVLDRKIASVKNTCSNPLAEFFRIFNVPEKKVLRKLASENFNIIFSYKFLSTIFSEHDNIMKIIKSASDIYQGTGISLYLEERYPNTKENENNYWLGRGPNTEIAQFHHEMIKKFGESIWATKVAQCRNEATIQDTYSVIKQILRKKPGMKLDLTGPIKEVHDRLSNLYDNLTHPNVTIPYVEDAYKLEDNLNGYEFKLAIDTQELRVIGREMNICVGSYGIKSLRKQCTIVFVRLNNKVKVCIELSGDMKTLKQAKVNSNHLPQDQDLEVIKKWMTKNKIADVSIDLGVSRPFSYNYDPEHIGEVPEGINVEALVAQAEDEDYDGLANNPPRRQAVPF